MSSDESSFDQNDLLYCDNEPNEEPNELTKMSDDLIKRSDAAHGAVNVAENSSETPNADSEAKAKKPKKPVHEFEYYGPLMYKFTLPEEKDVKMFHSKTDNKRNYEEVIE